LRDSRSDCLAIPAICAAYSTLSKFPLPTSCPPPSDTELSKSYVAVLHEDGTCTYHSGDCLRERVGAVRPERNGRTPDSRFDLEAEQRLVLDRRMATVRLMNWCQDATTACMFFVHLAMQARCPEMRKPPLQAYYKTCHDRTRWVSGRRLEDGTPLIVREAEFIAAEFCAKKAH
jgi:hypothetical protein